MSERGEEILQMADEVVRLLAGGHEPMLARWIQGRIEQAVLEEREACAKVAERERGRLASIADAIGNKTTQTQVDCIREQAITAHVIAKAIHARGKQADEP